MIEQLTAGDVVQFKADERIKLVVISLNIEDRENIRFAYFNPIKGNIETISLPAQAVVKAG